MPLHVCPQCEIAMETKPYEDVVIDVCPSCRSVWLDRGELQKIIAHVRRQENEDLLGIDPPQAAPPPPRDPAPEAADRGKRKKKRGFGASLFDVLEDLID